MGLTKAQKLERERAKEAAERTAAWTWLVGLDEIDRPSPMAKPVYDQKPELVTGWRFNTHTPRVDQAWQDTSAQYWKDVSNLSARDRAYTSGSKRRDDLYVTEADARLAMCYAMRDELAAKIARIKAHKETT